jgi:hypothetical protein
MAQPFIRGRTSAMDGQLRAKQFITIAQSSNKMSIHEINNQPSKIRRIPREAVEKREDYKRQHEIALLTLLIEENPERAKLIIERLKAKAV